MIEFFKNNYDWIFSGVGVSIFVYFANRSPKIKNLIKNRSRGIQAGGDININFPNDDKKRNKR